MKNLLFIALILFLQFPIFSNQSFDIDSFASSPVLHNGRIKPIDSVARLSLISLQEKISFSRDNKKLSPSEWFLDVISLNPKSNDDPIIKIIHPDLINELELDMKEKYFSYNQIHPKYQILQEKVIPISELEPLERSPYQKAVMQLWIKINLMVNLKHAFFPYPNRAFNDYLTQYIDDVTPGLFAFNKYNNGKELVFSEQEALVKFNAYFKLHQRLKELSVLSFFPNLDNYEDVSLWSNSGSELLVLLDDSRSVHPLLLDYSILLKSYSNNNPELFNNTLGNMKTFHNTNSTRSKFIVNLEYYFNLFNPLGNSISLYLLALLFSLFYFLLKKDYLFKFSFYATYIAFAIHTVGLILRMVITARPPVTNLYSSAVFIGWFSILLALFQEKIFKNKIGPILASSIGFITLIIAYHLSFQSDTMELMQAVLDSNFWLTTHVITITLGYSGTYLAGFIAIYYVIFHIFSKPSKAFLSQLNKMVFGIICFSLLLSFIGTVLGGIWADQSWGRFWGWDPKENGALLIVLWNALILHARMAGIIKIKGIMLASIFGNIVTSFSWFGVNMLGVGLHSYGFMEKEFVWLVAFSIIQIVFILLPFIPTFKQRYS